MASLAQIAPLLGLAADMGLCSLEAALVTMAGVVQTAQLSFSVRMQLALDMASVPTESVLVVQATQGILATSLSCLLANTDAVPTGLVPTETPTLRVSATAVGLAFAAKYSSCSARAIAMVMEHAWTASVHAGRHLKVRRASRGAP